MVELSELRELATLMREVGAVHARCGELEMHLGPLPLSSVAGNAAAPPAQHADDDEGDSLAALCGPIGLDPTIFRGKVA